MGYEELISKLQALLGESIDARARGELHAGKVRLMARADGYMEALLDAGLVDRDELLHLVAEVRRKHQGEPLSQVPAPLAAVG
ncbi:MAG: hypothetical protein OEZ06_15190 [Myxococcales bacterium]|nr:hypothetical protein [Myxococcales bacterium]